MCVHPSPLDAELDGVDIVRDSTVPMIVPMRGLYTTRAGKKGSASACRRAEIPNR
jgi:hypothetical protein